MPNTDANILALVQAFARDVTAAVEATALARVQAALAAAFGTAARRRSGRPPKQPTAVVAAPPTKRRKKASPKVVRARKLQGQYLGALKSLAGGDRAKVKAVAKDKGVSEAVKLALTLKKPKK
jgi:hypothetical protein